MRLFSLLIFLWALQPLPTYGSFSCWQAVSGEDIQRVGPEFNVLLETRRLWVGSPMTILPSTPGTLDIVRKVDRVIVGTITYSTNLRGSKVVSLPLGIYPSYRGAGYSYEAKFALLSYAFNVLDADLVVEAISKQNTTSINLHRKLGFVVTKEGKRKEKNLEMTLTREDFHQTVAKSN